MRVCNLGGVIGDVISGETEISRGGSFFGGFVRIVLGMVEMVGQWVMRRPSVVALQ